MSLFLGQINRQGTITLSTYDWIDLNASDGYDRLVQVLDAEFDPKGIAQRLKTQVTDAAKGVLVEHGYVDKDYRSTFYNFYAKKGRQYRSDCVRLHFFDGAVSYDKARTDILCTDLHPEHHYFGYIVVRPTIVATLGRSVLSPDIRLGARGRAIQSVHYVNLLGYRLPVWGFPSMAQHVDIAVCAHVCCWAILRYYSETFPQHREYLVHDITKLVAPFDPGGLVPSLGFNVVGAERVFQAAGYYPMLVGKRNSSSEAAFFSQFLAYLESGFPLFVAMPREKHAIAIVGYSWRQSPAPLGPTSSHVWVQVESLLIVDDNLLPYATVPLHSSGNPVASPSYTPDSFDAFVVALPDKMYYPADAIERYSQGVERSLIRARGPGQEPLELRRYFITTVSRLREYARDNHTNLGDSLVALIMHLDTAQFVWVVEFCSVAQWKAGQVAVRAIVDATASPTDRAPIWMLHDEDVAHVFDRSSAERKVKSIRLDRTSFGPLPRMELNLRPVVEASTPTSSSGESIDPGGIE